MARTTADWYNLIVAEKENQTVLNGLMNDAGTVDNFQNLLTDLNSKSRVSIWRLFVYIISYAYTILEGFMINFQADVETKAAAAVYANDDWWVKKAKEFQYGDEVVAVIDERTGVLVIKYPVFDSSKQIVKLAAISSQNGSATIKIAKGASTAPVPLTALEISAFNGYKLAIQPAGVNITVTSKNADKVKYSLKIRYRGQQNIEDIILPGGTIDYGLRKNVQDAITAYHNNLRFNGEISLTKLIDAIQLVEGVEDIEVISAFGRRDEGAYGSAFTSFYPSFAGYVTIAFGLGADDTDIVFTPI